MIECSIAFITSTYKKSPDKWKTQLASVAKELLTLLLLETVLESKMIPSKVQHSLLVDHGGLVTIKPDRR